MFKQNKIKVFNNEVKIKKVLKIKDLVKEKLNVIDVANLILYHVAP